MKLLWTERARRDLLDIGRFIARDNPRAARAWVERLRERAHKAAETPWQGELSPNVPIRKCVKYSYAITESCIAYSIMLSMY